MMGENDTEILARLEILESEVQEFREMVEGVGVVFEMDMDELAPDLMLLLSDDDDGTFH